MLDMQTVMGDKVWINYPFLKKYAEDFLTPDSAYELARAMIHVPNTVGGWLQDVYDISLAFSWANSPQGYTYWSEIFERNFDAMRYALDPELYVPDPIFIGGDATEVERTNEWVPDQAREDTMDITRGMFE